uniref:Uncharacterized protein n=1 Tax=Rhabditophanes sp. KR3021 TaxID=114890 RepID=A0AC35UDH5_9BILA
MFVHVPATSFRQCGEFGECLRFRVVCAVGSAHNKSEFGSLGISERLSLIGLKMVPTSVRETTTAIPFNQRTKKILIIQPKIGETIQIFGFHE